MVLAFAEAFTEVRIAGLLAVVGGIMVTLSLLEIRTGGNRALAPGGTGTAAGLNARADSGFRTGQGRAGKDSGSTYWPSTPHPSAGGRHHGLRSRPGRAPDQAAVVAPQ